MADLGPKASSAATIWDRFSKIGDLIADANFFGANPEVLLQDIQEQIDAIHERLAHVES